MRQHIVSWYPAIEPYWQTALFDTLDQVKEALTTIKQEISLTDDAVVVEVSLAYPEGSVADSLELHGPSAQSILDFLDNPLRGLN